MGAYQLKNEELTLTVISAGAEMKSLKDNKTEQEYLWQADPKFWGRTSPVLFPIVGNYVQKQSVYEGKTYTLSQHGFARDMEFDLESQTEEEIWFVLKDTESTLEKYPFHFILKVGYRLSGRQVEVMWKVENPNDKKMYFSIGGHPAFNCPLKEGEKQEDCQLIFDTEGPLTSSILNEEGALCPRTKILNLFGKCLKLEEHLFDEDALIIENHQAQGIGLADADGKVYIYFSQEQIAEMMGCGLKKVGSLLAELDSRKGIGLITRIRQGLGKPDRIYVRRCICVDLSEGNIQTRQNDISGYIKMADTDMSKVPGNDTDKNKTEINDTEYLSFLSADESEESRRKQIEREAYYKIICHNIGYEYLIEECDREMLDEIVALVVDVISSDREFIWIGRDRKPFDVVKSQFLKLNAEHIRFVMKCLRENTSKVVNIRQYLLTVLYNAPLTISNYYSALVQHDMYGNED